MRIQMDDLNKATFYADFFCSELAVEVYKNAVREVTSIDRVSYLVAFCEKLWQEIENNIDNGGNYEMDL